MMEEEESSAAPREEEKGEEEKTEEDEEEESLLQFHQMGLDDRLLKAIAHLGWNEPTLIQGIASFASVRNHGC